MNNIIEIKQIANKYAKLFNVKEGLKNATGFEGEFTAFPSSFRAYAINKSAAGRFITGLVTSNNEVERKIEEAKKEELEKVLGVDLGDTSSYWLSFFIRFRLPAGTMQLNLNKPEEYIMYKAAIANKLLAPNKDFIEENSEDHEDLVYYVFDIKEEESRKAKMQQLKDEISALMYNMRNSTDKLFYLCANKGKMVNPAFRAETLYAMMNSEKENMKSTEQLEKFRDYLNQSNELLQATYFVKKGIEKQIIKRNAEKKYAYKDISLGIDPDKVIEFIIQPANQELIVLIQMDLEEMTSKSIV